jgi:IS5 family transposase
MAKVSTLKQVISACEARVLRDEKVPISEKILSVSDPDAGYISKGQRESVIGYKPQIARSGAGFITGLLLPKGNAADSGQLVPMVNQVVARTGVVPTVVTVDDGYASAENVRTLKETPGIQIPIISINGAKGRALTAEADWASDDYADARNLRSAVESLMFTLKQGFHFGEVARRGLSAAYAELLEKALAYNVCHTVRRRQAAAAKSEHPPARATA